MVFNYKKPSKRHVFRRMQHLSEEHFHGAVYFVSLNLGFSFGFTFHSGNVGSCQVIFPGS